MTGWERFVLNFRLMLLEGQDNTLHSRIAQGYARGDYQSSARRQQQSVRAEMKSIRERLAK